MLYAKLMIFRSTPYQLQSTEKHAAEGLMIMSTKTMIPRAPAATPPAALLSPPPPPPLPLPLPRRVRFESASSSESSTSDGVTLADILPFRDRSASSQRRSWVIRTESNVRKWKRKVPDPPCVVCNGSGKEECYHCKGKGRENHTDLMMLPPGEWPKWCSTCGGSGLYYCCRCLGTGKYRTMDEETMAIEYILKQMHKNLEKET